MAPDPYAMRKEPAQGRSKAMVDAILEAAERILKKDEPERLDTNRIAEQAGASIGSLYQYFSSGDGILARLIERDLEKKEASFGALMQGLDDRPLPEAVQAIIAASADMFMAHPRLVRRMFVHAPRLSRMSTIIAHRKRIADLFARAMERRGVAAGPRASSAASVITDAVMGVFQMHVLRETRRDDMREVEGELVELVLGYIERLKRTERQC